MNYFLGADNAVQNMHKKVEKLEAEHMECSDLFTETNKWTWI